MFNICTPKGSKMCTEYIAPTIQSQLKYASPDEIKSLLYSLHEDLRPILGLFFKLDSKYENIFPSINFIAEQTGLSFSTCRRRLKILTGLGILITKGQAWFNGPQTYALHPSLKSKKLKGFIWKCLKAYRWARVKSEHLTVNINIGIKNYIKKIVVVSNNFLHDFEQRKQNLIIKAKKEIYEFVNKISNLKFLTKKEVSQMKSSTLEESNNFISSTQKCPSVIYGSYKDEPPGINTEMLWREAHKNDHNYEQRNEMLLATRCEAYLRTCPQALRLKELMSQRIANGHKRMELLAKGDFAAAKNVGADEKRLDLEILEAEKSFTHLKDQLKLHTETLKQLLQDENESNQTTLAICTQ
jgi:DNA-binding Lrp family transcriptional regulator